MTLPTASLTSISWAIQRAALGTGSVSPVQCGISLAQFWNQVASHTEVACHRHPQVGAGKRQVSCAQAHLAETLVARTSWGGRDPRACPQGGVMPWLQAAHGVLCCWGQLRPRWAVLCQPGYQSLHGTLCWTDCGVIVPCEKIYNSVPIQILRNGLTKNRC